MTTGQLQALAARLRDHAAMHESIVPCDDEQRQWRDDLIAAAKYLRQCTQADAIEALRELVEALDGAYISSWQSTAAWQTQLDCARAVLAAQGGDI